MDAAEIDRMAAIEQQHWWFAERRSPASKFTGLDPGLRRDDGSGEEAGVHAC